MMPRPDEKFGATLELPLRLSRLRQDQAVDAAAILVQPVENVESRARLVVNLKRAEQPPMPAR
jgi:hypothetical protein